MTYLFIDGRKIKPVKMPHRPSAIYVQNVIRKECEKLNCSSAGAQILRVK